MITCNINGISHWFHIKPTCQSKYLLLQLLYHLSWSCWLERKLSMKNMYVKDNIHQAIIFNYKENRKSNGINISLGGYTSTWLIIVYTDSNQKSFTSDSIVWAMDEKMLSLYGLKNFLASEWRRCLDCFSDISINGADGAHLVLFQKVSLNFH